MDKLISQEEFLSAVEIVEKYLAQVLDERDKITEKKRTKLSLERFMDTMQTSKRLWNALINYQKKWGINPTVDEMTKKRIQKTLGFGKHTISEFEHLRDVFMKMQGY